MKPAAHMIADFRTSRGIKQVHVAQKTGISAGRLSAIERGRMRVSADEFLQIVTLGFGMTPQNFFDLEVSENET